MKLDLNTLLNEWEKDSHIDELALDEETRKGAKLHAKYLRYLSEYKLKLKHQDNKRDVLKKNLWLYYSGKMTKPQMDHLKWPYDPYEGGTKPMKSDMGRYMDADDNYIELMSKIEYTKTMLDALEEIMNTLRWRHAGIKNMIDWRRFVSGG